MIFEAGARNSRSVWSASSLLALSNGRGHTKAGASSAHSKRFAQFLLRYFFEPAATAPAAWCWRLGIGFRHPDSRSVWSASSLLALSNGRGHTKAGASSAHSKRFAQFLLRHQARAPFDWTTLFSW